MNTMTKTPITKKPRLIIINKKEQPTHAIISTPTESIPLERTTEPSSFTALIACTRFNNKTWKEYQDWKAINQHIYEEIYKRPLKCIYGSPREISHTKIPPQHPILVIEMNNDENKIQGIGLIHNETASEVYRSQSSKSAPKIKYSKIFSDRNYTRYFYIGNSYYAAREELIRNHTADAQYINVELDAASATTPQTSQEQHHPQKEETRIEYLERLLFKGARHMKRGSGISLVLRGNNNRSRKDQA